MPPSRSSRVVWLTGLAFALGMVVPAVPLPAVEDGSAVRLFRIVTIRTDVLLGLTARELAALGSGAEVDRLARCFAEAGQVTAWHYRIGRSSDGAQRWMTSGRVAVLRDDALLVVPYADTLPIMAPPTV